MGKWEYWEKILQPVITALILAFIYWLGRQLKRLSTEHPSHLARLRKWGLYVLFDLFTGVGMLYAGYCVHYGMARVTHVLNWYSIVILMYARCLRAYEITVRRRVLSFVDDSDRMMNADSIGEMAAAMYHAIGNATGPSFTRMSVYLVVTGILYFWGALYLALVVW